MHYEINSLSKINKTQYLLTLMCDSITRSDQVTFDKFFKKVKEIDDANEKNLAK